MKKLKVVVAGGAGFIGPRLVDGLMERDDRVIVYDNFDEYPPGKKDTFTFTSATRISRRRVQTSSTMRLCAER
ncbi:MAG: NAD-dependent epimerase/dehydratase family protein [Candidatus Geothermarchaeales archaeon]